MKPLQFLLLLASTLAAEEFDASRFEKQIIVPASECAMQLEVLPDGRVFFLELSGKVKRVEPRTGHVALLGQLPVAQHEKAHDRRANGFVLAPDFATSQQMFFLYSPLARERSMRLSRFTLKEGKLDLGSEKMLLELPMELMSTAGHYGGGLAWTPQGDLVIGTGDYTFPRGTGTFDDRPGMETDDSQRSSANSQDLRGKILRITPQPDGTYIIPKGNIYADAKQGRPEIFALGLRNPFRLSVDPRTGFIYWGDVGQNVQPELKLGPEGYDEINQARTAGFFGFPYFTGPNEAYRHYDYETKKVGDLYDVNAPRNDSRNNTGAKALPPPQPAFIWYPSAESKQFPILGSGGRSAMAGPVFYADPAVKNELKLPDQFDHTLFIHDWMRNWIMAVKLDADERMASIQPFLPAMKWRRPIAVKVAPDHSLYVIEYGDKWFDNTDSQIVRLVYQRGNRAPVAAARADVLAGKQPLKVQLDASASADKDGDPLTYRWSLPDGSQREGVRTEVVFANPGQNLVKLTVTDSQGASAADELSIAVGNTPPVITFIEPANGSFYDSASSIAYRVEVADAEDGSTRNGSITAARITVEAGTRLRVTNEVDEFTQPPGLKLMRSITCFACHTISAKSVGPGYLEVAKKYQGDEKARETLAQKILTGGVGVWGKDIPMPPHPQHTLEQTLLMVDWILSLATASGSFVQSGTSGLLTAPDFVPKDNKWYMHPMPPVLALEASYTDNGCAAAAALRGTGRIILHPRTKRAATFDRAKSAETVDMFKGGEGNILRLDPDGWFAFEQMNLSGVASLRIRLAARYAGITHLEAHLDSTDGPCIARHTLKPCGSEDRFEEIRVPIADTAGLHTLYFVAKPEGEMPHETRALLDVNWIEFCK